jgi:hypothetical protein
VAVVDVAAHELGHSFLFHHWRWTREARFRRIFGEVDKAYRVGDGAPVFFERRRVAYAPVEFVSSYASTHPLEDFAETFMLYLKHGTRRPAKFKSVAIQRRWQFVTDLTERIAAGAARW